MGWKRSREAEKIVREWDANNGICLLHDHETDLVDVITTALSAARDDGRTPVVCTLCEKGFPTQEGVHYGTQSLGMIPSRICDNASPEETAAWLVVCSRGLQPGEWAQRIACAIEHGERVGFSAGRADQAAKDAEIAAGYDISDNYSPHWRNGAIMAAHDIRDIIKGSSPDPSYVERVRTEQREANAQLVESRQWSPTVTGYDIAAAIRREGEEQ